MSQLLTIDVDARGMIAALDRLGEAAAMHVRQAAFLTAGAIKQEALARVARRTGTTAAGITVAPTDNGDGYVVFVERQQLPGLPGWLEHGTQFMTARPFLFVAARLEVGPHDRRISEAIQDAIEEANRG